MKKVIFVRHGETAINKAGLLHEYKDTKTLNDDGIKQIKRTAEELRKYNPEIICSSDEKRSIESAEIIARALEKPHKIIKGLEERNWGKFSGKPWSEINRTILSKMSIEERYNYVPPQGESWKNFEERLINALKEILNSKENNIIIVTHGGAIRALMPFLLNVPKEESFKYDPDNASISIFEFDGQKFNQIIYNDTSYIK